MDYMKKMHVDSVNGFSIGDTIKLKKAPHENSVVDTRMKIEGFYRRNYGEGRIEVKLSNSPRYYPLTMLKRVI